MTERPTIRPARDVAEIEQCVALQQVVWGFPDIEAVPVAELQSVAQGGGYLRVAELDGTLVGYCYGFWTLVDGRPELYSRQLAVLPAHRGRGIGLALKLDQRAWALEQGAERIRWTCHPLQAGNARLNFGRLGCESSTFKRDFYGSRANDIQRGLPTDRLVVEWRLAAPRVAARVHRRTTPPVLAEVVGDHPAWLRAEGTAEAPDPVSERPGAPAIRVEVPRAILELRDRDLDRAVAWAMAMRDALTEAFAAGYRIVEFASAPDRAAAGAYLLRQR